MIDRRYLACKTCGHVHIARIQVGHAARQEHSFPCEKCKEPIRVALDVDSANCDLEFHCLENCLPHQRDDNGTYVYLTPEFIADRTQINNQFYFGSSDFFKELSGVLPHHQMLNSANGVIRNNSEEWSVIQKIWRLENSRQFVLSGALNTQYANQHGLEESTFGQNLFHFLGGLFDLDESLFKEVFQIQKAYPSEFARFVHYYQVNLRDSHRRSQLEILSEYFKAYSEHAQVVLYVRRKIPVRENFRVTSTNFPLVKSFYASAYEFFASEVCILTCLNNIKQGRKFDQLSSISLSRYLETDKAKRRVSIESNAIFSTATEEFDSKIRNASFHNWFFLRPDHETIEYRSGGTGAVETLSYTQYLFHCGKMMEQICKLLSLELAFDESARFAALVRKLPL